MRGMVGVLGGRRTSAIAAAWNRDRVRAIAYHDVENPAAFAAHLELFKSNGYHTITSGQLADWIELGHALPDRPLWITFDDGDATVVQHALPLLCDHGMVATAFLCGAWVGTTEAPWWQVVAAAVDARVVRSSDFGERSLDVSKLVQVRLALKRSADADRRRVVAAFGARLAEIGRAAMGNQWSEADVQAWSAAGNEIGNHSWDHPCLDRCDEAEQRRQVRLAHDRLSVLVGRRLDVFAWPNGDASPAAASELRQLEYRVVAACDHRLVSARPDPLALSRLRLDSSVDLPRTRAILSGGHSAVFHLQQRILRRSDPYVVT